MTYCLGIKTKDGLVALADGRITAGTQVTCARKISVMGEGKHRFFIMTSGLRSIRDKAIAYLERQMKKTTLPYPSMLEALTAYTECLRQVEKEDSEYLVKGGLTFNLHSIVGGMLEEDEEPRLFLVYPEGNWIEVDQLTPYVTIGAIGYGKPILDRALRFDTELRTAMKIAYLSFDSTQFSSSDVGFPLDMLCFSLKDFSWREQHLQEKDTKNLREWWNENISGLVAKSPDDYWLSALAPERSSSRTEIAEADNA
jgi:putative proteasome-type protease